MSSARQSTQQDIHSPSCSVLIHIFTRVFNIDQCYMREKVGTVSAPLHHCHICHALHPEYYVHKRSHKTQENAESLVYVCEQINTYIFSLLINYFFYPAILF